MALYNENKMSKESVKSFDVITDTTNTNNSANITDSTNIIDKTDLDQLKMSIQNVILDTLNNVESSMYQDAKFDFFFESEVYESFTYIDYETFRTIYEKIKEETVRRSKQTWRSYKENLHYFDYSENRHFYQIERLKKTPQPQQRTKEWYEFRKDHLTGSNSWKIFSSESCQKQLMFEKLEPPKVYQEIRPNLNDQQPMNWGHKYEPVSILLYEFYNNVVVEEFGCIEHNEIKCLAASPDGIVTSVKNNGRMIEVKNPTTREITQVPKIEYYIQMQLQMEVCQLEECDFVETKFKEYDTRDDFENDKYKLEKGMIIVMIKNGTDLVYEYSPLLKNKLYDLEKFINDTYQKYGFTDETLENGEFKWFKNVYWYLDTFSCVLIPRNRKWFSNAKDKITTFWSNILKEREEPNSYLKYKPKSKSKVIQNVIKLTEDELK